MRLGRLLLAALLTGATASAQEHAASSPETSASPSQDTLKDSASLNHIREELAKPAPVLSTLWANPDFRIEIQERVRIEQILSTLDYKAGPVPPGGLYGYEQQQQVFNKTDHPLMQPYAAFNGGELITIAIENLAMKYLGGRALNAVSNSLREHAEAAAREEVAQAIDRYCEQRADRADIKICTDALH